MPDVHSSCAWVCSRPILALNCLLQKEEVDSEDEDSDDDPLVMALRLCSALQTLGFTEASRISL